MEKNLVGYRFYPTGEELINHYLKNKILGKPWLVDEAISEINIYGYEPICLPSLSKLESNDLVWYFFCHKEITTEKKKGTKRTTPSGFWKATGVDREIKDRRGNGVKIGIKKTLVYHEGKAGKGVRTDWVMHEYHITSLPLHLVEQPVQEYIFGLSVDDLLIRMNEPEDLSLFYPETILSNDYPYYLQSQTPCDDEYFRELLSCNGGNFDNRTYVICQVMYKGDDGDSLYGNNSNELSNSVVSDLNTARGINTAPEVEQPVQEDIYFSVDDLLIPMNEPEDPSLFNPDTILSGDYPYQQPLTPCDDEYIRQLLSFNGGNFDAVIPEIMMVENNNDHRPRKPLTGFIVDCSSESDSESISAMSYRETSSPGDSDASSGRHFYTSVDEILSSRKDSIQTSAETFINRKTRESHFTRRTRLSKQEVKEGKSKAVDASMDNKSSSSSSASSSSMVKTEKKGWFITEEAMQRNIKNPPYIYLMNMIIGFILLVAVVGNIISVLLSLKTSTH